LGWLYRAAYVVGFKPWDTGVSPPELVALVEGASALSPGRALDLGCGTGTNAVYLALHDWDVTGIDNASRAISSARRKSSEAGVKPRFVEGDVTRLDALGIGDGYGLLLDLGCYHSLPKSQCDAYARGVTAVAASGATLLLYGFLPGLLPGTAGVTAKELQTRFPDWELIKTTRGTNWLPTMAFELRRR
jgi:SAM-dependent methyltransferase